MRREHGCGDPGSARLSTPSRHSSPWPAPACRSLSLPRSRSISCSLDPFRPGPALPDPKAPRSWRDRPRPSLFRCRLTWRFVSICRHPCDRDPSFGSTGEGSGVKGAIWILASLSAGGGPVSNHCGPAAGNLPLRPAHLVSGAYRAGGKGYAPRRARYPGSRSRSSAGARHTGD